MIRKKSPNLSRLVTQNSPNVQSKYTVITNTHFYFQDMCESMRKATSQFENWAREICVNMRGTPVAMQMMTLLLLGTGSLVIAFFGLITYRKYITSRKRIIHKKMDDKSDHIWEV